MSSELESIISNECRTAGARFGLSPEDAARLAEHIDDAIRRNLGAGYIWIRCRDKTKRNRQIALRFKQGETTHQLARAYDLTERQIRSILSRIADEET
jgi:Mor family transcriptional regulator